MNICVIPADSYYHYFSFLRRTIKKQKTTLKETIFVAIMNITTADEYIYIKKKLECRLMNLLLRLSTHLLSWTSWMFSMPMALLRRELKGPDFFLVGLFPGMISDWRRGAKEKRFKYTVWRWSKPKWFANTCDALWEMCNSCEMLCCVNC